MGFKCSKPRVDVNTGHCVERLLSDLSDTLGYQSLSGSWAAMCDSMVGPFPLPLVIYVDMLASTWFLISAGINEVEVCH